MAINRYQGNTGKVQRIAEATDTPVSIAQPSVTHAAQTAQDIRFARPTFSSQNRRPPRLQSGGSRGGLGFLNGIAGFGKPAESGELGEIERILGGILSRFTDIKLETEDIILLLIIWLMYKESEDDELLYVLGIMLFL